MTYSNLIEPISPKESPTEFPDASVDEDDNTDGDIKQIVETGSVTVSKDGHYIHCLQTKCLKNSRALPVTSSSGTWTI